MSASGQTGWTLPNRRISRREKVELKTRVDGPAYSFYVGCGFHPDGSVREVFFSSKRETADMVEVVTDSCILISKQLQSGARLADLAVQAPEGILGTIITVARKIESDCAEEVLAEYARAA